MQQLAFKFEEEGGAGDGTTLTLSNLRNDIDMQSLLARLAEEIARDIDRQIIASICGAERHVQAGIRTGTLNVIGFDGTA